MAAFVAGQTTLSCLADVTRAAVPAAQCRRGEARHDGFALSLRGGRSYAPSAAAVVRGAAGSPRAALALAASAAFCLPRRRRKQRGRTAAAAAAARSGRTLLKAIVEDDAHSQALKTWVDKYVIGLELCPWAQPSKEAEHFRVVTSTASSAEAALLDLAEEARKLPRPTSSGDEAAGVVTNTLMVCPQVEEWNDFKTFDAFFDEKMDGGEVFEEDFDLHVIAFHPQYSVHSSRFEVGDLFGVDGEDGEELEGTVVEASEAHGRQIVKVRLESGKEKLMMFPIDDEAFEWANLSHRSPRACFHLLRNRDLDRARSNEEAIRRRRELCQHNLGELGAAGVDRYSSAVSSFVVFCFFGL
eukprot:TRINITY_DN24264_c1_g1_i1.p1 TRINITY_DN24264_c1_g1~~TRINITY_DN24264_c1_g1_i1.p1  ORF type:complete len:356 (+),score=94.90 TRINITY_DN24264_c1_g1_i1:162-1229(+)